MLTGRYVILLEILKFWLWRGSRPMLLSALRRRINEVELLMNSLLLVCACSSSCFYVVIVSEKIHLYLLLHFVLLHGLRCDLILLMIEHILCSWCITFAYKLSLTFLVSIEIVQDLTWMSSSFIFEVIILLYWGFGTHDGIFKLFNDSNSIVLCHLMLRFTDTLLFGTHFDWF